MTLAKELPDEQRDLIDSVGNERWVPDYSDVEWMESLNPREIEEIRLAHFYAQSPQGTAGHNRLLLIAKLADRLSTIEDLTEAARLSNWSVESAMRIRDALLAGEG